MPSPYIETTDGTTLFVRDWGTGKPVLFLHGWALNSDMWQYQMIHLAENGLRTIAYDRRGHGRSADPGRGYDYDTLADDLALLLEHLQLEDVTLVGHSMSGGEIVRYLSRHGAASIARIVLLAPTLPFPLKTPDNPDGIDGRLFHSLRASWCRDFPRYLADNALPFFTPETSQGMIDWTIGMMLGCSLKAVLDCNRAMVETDFRSELQKIAVPVTIIHGDGRVRSAGTHW